MTQQHPFLLRLFALLLVAYGALWAEELSAQGEGISVSYSSSLRYAWLRVSGRSRR